MYFSHGLAFLRAGDFVAVETAATLAPPREELDAAETTTVVAVAVVGSAVNGGRGGG